MNKDTLMFTCKGCNTSKINSEDDLCDDCSDFCNEEIEKICESKDYDTKFIFTKVHTTVICCQEHTKIIPLVYKKSDQYYGNEPCLYCDYSLDETNVNIQYLKTLDEKKFTKA